MAIKINKPNPITQKSEGASSSSSQKPQQTKETPQKRRGSSPKNTKEMRQKKEDRKAANQLRSLDATLEKFHSKGDEELASFIQPKPGMEDRTTHRLDEDQREARLVLLHRMMIRKIAPDEIRKQLGVSTTMYYKLRDQLSERMRLDVNKVDVPYLIGDTMAFYDEIRSMALTISSSASIQSANTKLSAMNVALKAEQDKNNFLVQCGVYSAPVVEHIVRGMVSTGNFNTVDGQSQRVVDAEEVNMELALRLKEFAKARMNPVAVNCNPAGE